MKLAENLSLPPEIVTETVSVLGRRGSGKTHTASVLVEEMLAAGQQVVVLDPLDVWHGLRSSADGKSEGFAIVVFGGAQADLPLEGDAGATLADVILETSVSAVLSLRHLSKREAKAFVGAFCERLYARKSAPAMRRPLHVVIDEADEFVPQRVTPDVARAYGAIDTIVRRGRSSGLGTTLISQRAAVIAKDVLTQTEVLVCHQTTGPQDRKALEAWVEQHDDAGHRREFLDSLASLNRGEAWVWSPGLLQCFARVQVRRRRTFDSSSTPKVGERAVVPERVAVASLEDLRARIAALALEATPKGRASDSGELAELRAENERLRDALARVTESHARIAGAIRSAAALLDESPTEPAPVPAPRTELLRPSRHFTVPPPRSPRSQREPSADVSVSKCARGILTALAQLGTLSLEQAAIVAGYAPDSGGVRNAAGELRSKALVEGANANLVITRTGAAASRDVAPLPTGRELLEFWNGKLAKAEREILAQVVRVYPRPMSLDTAATKAGYAPTSGGVRNAAGRLRTLMLVEGSNAGMVANGRLVG